MLKGLENIIVRLLDIPVVEVNKVAQVIKARKLRIQERQVAELQKQSQRLDKVVQAELRAHRRAAR
jgi:hypothetical protein